MSHFRKQIKNKVDQLKREAATSLQEMVCINSENPPGKNPEPAKFLAEKLKGWGDDREYVQPPEELLGKLGLPAPRPRVVAKLKEYGLPTMIF